MKKFGINGQLPNKLFLIVIHRFSLAKAVMNAPCICKMRNGVKLKRRRSKTLKDSQRTGGGADFSKKPPLHSL